MLHSVAHLTTSYRIVFVEPYALEADSRVTFADRTISDQLCCLLIVQLISSGR